MSLSEKEKNILIALHSRSMRAGIPCSLFIFWSLKSFILYWTFCDT